MPEERQAQMKNDKAFDSMYTEDSLPERYDSWIKKVLDGLILNEVRSLARKKRREKEILSQNVENLAACEPFEEEELVEILLGDTPIMLKDEKLAASLSKIGRRKQQAIDGTIILGMPVGVLADLLGLDPRIVSNYKLRGLDELRSMMEGSEDE